MKTSRECRSSAGASPCAWSVALAWFPGMQARPPGGHRPPVGLVFSAEAVREAEPVKKEPEKPAAGPRVPGKLITSEEEYTKSIQPEKELPDGEKVERFYK